MPSHARRSSSQQVPLTRTEERVVVVGSGFGGGVSALRLAQAGVRVLVLERGRRWTTAPGSKPFPSAFRPDKRALWYESAPRLFGRPLFFDFYAGLMEAVVGSNMTAVCAAGVGGGSLIYQGMTLQPAESVFNAHLPEQLDYPRMSAVHYPRVAQMLKVDVAPDELIESATYIAPRAFARNVLRQGFELSKIPMPIEWNYALSELRGEMTPCFTNGDCALGVNNGGKHSIDVTYLAQAEQTGFARVEPLHRVTDISQLPTGKWNVHVDRTDESGTVLEQKIVTTKALILAAGSVGTTKLLVRAGALDAIRNLPDELGKGWGTNADRIYVWRNTEDDLGAVQGGPVVYGSREWDDPGTANTIIHASLAPFPGNRHQTMIVGFGVSEARGEFVYDAKKDCAVLQWPKNGDAVAHKRIAERARAIVGPRGRLFDTNAFVPTTWHPLGGACMGTVCDLEGRVQGQHGLYVLDGALLPGNTAACNPSMTIAAIAERAMDDIMMRDIGTLI